MVFKKANEKSSGNNSASCLPTGIKRIVLQNEFRRCAQNLGLMKMSVPFPVVTPTKIDCVIKLLFIKLMNV